ncbi:MAG: helix-turn-helix domain-containing protein [Gammaproteobacteria bacterium]|nr:helix-turn-helix domain-containing protein [Gammaproteobacteria bacterium]
MDNTKPESADMAAPRSGPGRLLRQARLDLRLAPEDVAQILHLSSKHITALEMDDYHALPGATYVRGYLRSYAQLLGLTPEKVVEAYNSLTLPSKPILPPQSAPPPEITSSHRVVKGASIGVAAIVLGLVYLWWQSNDQPLEQTVQPSAETGRVSVGVAPPQNVSSDISPSATSANLPPASGGEPVAQTSPGVTPVLNATGPTTSPSGQLTVSGMTPDVAPAESPKPVANAPAVTERTMRTRRAVNIPPGVPRARVVLHAVQESWADIRDARDNRLLYENVPAGRRISIEGVAPFSVFLGNADGVRVEFNGQNYDVSRYKRGQVARFTLGEEAAVNN